MDPVQREVHRERWRRVRTEAALEHPERAEFGTGGLGSRVPNLSARLLVLPADPEDARLEFGEEFWIWWKAQTEQPIPDRPVRWGSDLFPMSSAAICCAEESSQPQRWRHYVALYRSGGLDLALGETGASQRETHRLFRVLAILGRVWGALALYRAAVSRFSIAGPWECSLALIGTGNGQLMHLATGWRDYPDPGANPNSCTEQNLLWRRELDEWPDEEGIRLLSHSIGGWIEDSWRMRERRFIARTGPLDGQFDWSRYS